MNVRVKKTLYVCVSAIIFLLAVLMILPFAFKDKINVVTKDKINSMLNAKVDYKDLDVSFIRNFPNVSVRLEKFKIVGLDAFSKDTLVQAEDIDLTLNLFSVFGKSGYEVEKLKFSNPKIFAHVLPDGSVNWDVMKTDSTKVQEKDTAKMNFNLQLKSFQIENADITYWDEKGKIKAILKGLNHTTSGDFSADSSLLVTKTSLDSLNFWMEGVKYMSNTTARIDADIDANLNSMVFTFNNNSSTINAIPFSVTGWLKVMDEGFDMDLKLNTDKVDFKSILSMIPAIYAKDFEGLKAGGNAKLEGFMKGKMVGENYPAFKFSLQAVDGWFQYPVLPQKVTKINVRASVTNPGGTVDATVVDISDFSLIVAGNPFKASMRLATPVSDPDFSFKALGKLDLSKIKDFYPLSDGTQLNGVFDMNMEMGGKMSYYERNEYDKFRFNGRMNVVNLILKMKDLPQQVGISRANMNFNNRFVDLSAFDMSIGKNDLHATGRVENLMAYVLKNKVLKANLSLESSHLNASDFMSSSKGSVATADSSKLALFVIPSNIDFTMTAKFKELLYEKMKFTNAKGILLVQNGDLTFKNLGMDAFGGNMLMNGVYSTAEPSKPSVKFDMAINEVYFTEIVKQVDMLQKIAPIFNNASGKFSTKFAFNSLLKQDMKPDLATMLGSGSLNTKSVGLSNVPVVSALTSGLKISGLNPATVKDLSLMFEIKDGKVTTKPFNVNLGDLRMNLSGFTAFDKTIAYSGVVQVPSRFSIGGKLSTVNVKIAGSFDKPKVQVDLASLVSSVLGDSKGKAQAEVSKQVNNAKDKAIEAAKAKAEQLQAGAKQVGDQLINEAQKKSDELVEKATNPITRKLAQTAGKKLVDEAKKKAADLNAKAVDESQSLIDKASGN